MNIFKRSQISILRQPIKSLTLFAILILLGSMMAGAISVSNAIQVTERNLRRRIPPIARVDQDSDAILAYIDEHEQFPDWESALTSEMIESIGHLSYVRAFDYAILDSTGFFSRDLSLPNNPEPYLVTGLDESIILFDLEQRSRNFDGLQQLSVRGIHNYTVFDLQEGIIELVNGRVFTKNEMNEGAPVVLVSDAFANTNNLAVGSTFVLEQNLYDWSQGIPFDEIFQDDNLLVSEPLEVEVIGIFIPTVQLSATSNSVEIANHMDFNNLIYAPLQITKNPTYHWLDYLRENAPERIPYYEGFWYQYIVFVLYDSLYLNDFSIAALDLLPEFWLTDDLTSAFVDMTSSLETLQAMSTWIMRGATVATITTLSLLIILFLHDRQHEMGIYLALGETRKKIIGQVLAEVFLVAITSILVSLFVGHALAEGLSYEMIRQELAANRTPANFDQISFGFNDMGFGFWMTHEEMIEAYTVSLDSETVFAFIGISMGVIFISTLLPIIYITKISPKEILMKGTIG